MWGASTPLARFPKPDMRAEGDYQPTEHHPTKRLSLDGNSTNELAVSHRLSLFSESGLLFNRRIINLDRADNLINP